MTIHNLSPEANILYASESIVDILGFQPGEVIGKSCFEYFHPDEIPFARRVHSRGVQMDKAASLHYARVMNREGLWVGCECVFTIVYEVLVACTSIYKGDAKNERRAVEAPVIRRLFASSPRDPRYHMLEHLSAKFRTPPQASLLEPRAALILNRFTRTLTVMYATNAVSGILGVTPDQLKDKSFYECIQENCLPEAIRCLESAKANDSIAYLRFWYRDPRRQQDLDDEMHEASASSDSEDGGVELTSPMDIDPNTAIERRVSQVARQETRSDDQPGLSESHPVAPHNSSLTSSGESTDLEHDSPVAIFDQLAQPSRPSTSTSPEHLEAEPRGRRQLRRPMEAPQPPAQPLEIEAVVSCTSDGLVVVLRRARPVIPSLQQPAPVPQYAHGLFAAPWGANPVRPHVHHFIPQHPFRHGLLAPQLPAGGPVLDEFMNSIREVAVFAWSLTGINGNIASYGRGTPRGESLPPGGLPIWDPFAQPSPGYISPENQAYQRWLRLNQKANEPRGNVVPYQHQHQESNLGRRNGIGTTPMGSDEPVSMRRGSLDIQFSFACAPHAQDEKVDTQNPHGQSGWPATIPGNVSPHVQSPQAPNGTSTEESRRTW